MFGEYAAFIIPAYLITALSLLGTTCVIYFTYRKRKTELDRLVSETE